MKGLAILRRLQPIRTSSNQRARAFAFAIGFIVLAMISCGDERGASSSHPKSGYIENERLDRPAALAYLKPSRATAQTEPTTSAIPTYELKMGQKELSAMER